MAGIGHSIIGSGPECIIVCHGWFGDHSAFSPCIPFLDRENFTYAFMDYRGYGKSRHLNGEYTMAEIAGDAIALADDLGWKNFHMIGHSMGGMAIQRTMLDAGGRVRSLIALTPVPAGGVPFDEEGRALFEGAAKNDENRYGIIDFTTGNRLTPTWIKAMVDASRATTEELAFAGYFPAWADTDFADEVKGNDTPVLVLIGEHDPALNAEFMQSTYMEWYPKAEMQTIANAGHYPMQETPVALVTVMEEFLKRQSG